MPSSTSRCVLVRHTTSALHNASNHSGQSLAGLSCAVVSSQPVAISSAITIGAMPALKARTDRSSRLRCPHCAVMYVSVQDGINIPIMVMLTPSTLAQLRVLQTQGFEDVRGLSLSADAHAQLERALQRYMNFVLERAPKSAQLLRQLHNER